MGERPQRAAGGGERRPDEACEEAAWGGSIWATPGRTATVWENATERRCRGRRWWNHLKEHVFEIVLLCEERELGARRPRRRLARHLGSLRHGGCPWGTADGPVTPPRRPAESVGAMEGPGTQCQVLLLEHWVAVGQGQEMELRREVEALPGGLKGHVVWMTLSSRSRPWQGSVLSREQLFEHDSGRWRGGEGRGAETQ